MKKTAFTLLLSVVFALAAGVSLSSAQQGQSPVPPKVLNTNSAKSTISTLRGANESTGDSIVLQLRSGAFDPLQGVPSVPAPLNRSLESQEAGLRLVQFSGPIQDEWYAAMIKAGLEIVTYMPDYAYLVWGDATAIDGLQTMAPVRWSGAYQPFYALSPQLSDAAKLPSDVDVTVQLFEHPGVDVTQQAILEKAKELSEPDTVLNYLNLRVSIPANQLDWLASLPDVINVEPAPHYQMLDEVQGQIMAGNLNASGTQPSGPGYLSWLTNTIGFTTTAGAYPIVDITDDGIDNGTTTPLHPDFWTFGVAGTTSRLMFNYNWSTAPSANGIAGHGNINASIVGGYNDRTGAAYEDTNGYNYGLGVSPFGRIAGSKVFNNSGNFTTASESSIISNTYALGARISSNSWGANTGGAYDAASQTYDARVRDAQAGIGMYAGNQEIITIFAAGNYGAAANSVGSPGGAKNVISVGAAENYRPTWTDGCGVNPTGADSAQDIIYFSSRGPMDDARVKPDIMAPGTHIEGAASQAPGYTGTGICDAFMPIGQTLYAASSGTSHSTPAIAGAASLLYRYYQDHFGGQPPSPAMTKAYLLNTTRYMTGTSANDTLPSNNQGLGEVHLGRAFDNVPRLVVDQSYLFSGTAQIYQVQGVIPNAGQPFRVTLAWTDAPGPTTGNAYVNNLDLAVSIGGNTYRGNVFNGQFSTTGGTADPRNNVESVFLPAGLSGEFIVSVTAANIAGDGVPGNADSTDQDFALVVYNYAPASSFPMLNVADVNTSDAGGNNNGSVDPGEVIRMNVGLRNIGSVTATTVSGIIALTSGNAVVSTPAAAYANIAPAATITNTFPYVFQVSPSQVCGQPLIFAFTATYNLTRTATGTLNIPIGTPITTPQNFQNFDGVSAPALPAGWTSTASGAQLAWVTQNAISDSAPNNAFSPSPAAVGVNELVTPVFTPTLSTASITFRNNYNLETGFDGGVLEISINGGAYTDIVAAGGSFASGGYNGTISTAWGNPLAGRSAWTGSSGGYITTIVNLPAAAAGQPVRLRWRVGTDSSTAGTGQRIDTIQLTDGAMCGAPPAALTWTGNTSANWFVASNWNPAVVPTTASTVLIPTSPTGNRWPVITGTAGSYSLTIQAGAMVTIAQGAALAIDGGITNNGTLAQIKDAPSSSTTEFLHLMNTAGNVDQYHGVDLTPAGALGVTTVQIKGNQTACTTVPTDPIVHRCYRIDPTTPNSAITRFWYAEGERNSQAANALNLWHWNPWTQVGTLANYTYSEGGTTCTSGGGRACWLQVTAISTYSPFALGSGSNPTAVHLITVKAARSATTPLLPFGAALLLSASAIVWKRRRV